MAQVVITKLAQKDLNSIHDFIAQDSVYYAQLVIERIFKRMQMLEAYPKSGRAIPEFEDRFFRELIEGNYRIFYKIKTNDEISIIRVFHAARLIRKK